MKTWIWSLDSTGKEFVVTSMPERKCFYNCFKLPHSKKGLKTGDERGDM